MDNKTIEGWLIILALLNLCVTGGILNMKAMIVNGGKMPVATGYEFEAEEHFGYINESNISSPELTDKYLFADTYYSIGDILMYFAIMIIIWILLFMLWRNYTKCQKKEE